MRLSPVRVVSALARLYISVIRGTPLLLQLFIIFYGLPPLGVQFDPFPAAVSPSPSTSAGTPRRSSARRSSRCRKGQWEAAIDRRDGPRTTLRRVVLPQAARTAVPPLSNTLISLVKDTSLASTILVTELLRQAQDVAAPTFQFFALYGVAAVYYWVVCLVLSFGQSRLEPRQNRYVAA